MVIRFVGFIITLTGTVIVALNINFFQSTTELGDDGKRTLVFILRLEEGNQIKNLLFLILKIISNMLLLKENILKEKFLMIILKRKL